MKNLLSTFEEIETPFYWYDLKLLDDTLDALKKANKEGYHVHYALKANNNPRIIERIKQAGLGIDCVSGGEVKHALDNGFDPSQIVLAGVGKTDQEIAYAIENDIFSFNVESIEELEVINEIAGSKGKKPNISIRINPAIDAGTHHKITTGTKENKFGISDDDLFASVDLIKSLKHISFIGVHYHIGSQIIDLTRFKNLAIRINEIQQGLIDKGIELPHLNVGGGLGIDYLNPDGNPIPDFEHYFGVFRDNLQLLPGQELHFELGRSIVGQCGSLITRVLFVKRSGHTSFLIVDAGMTDLMRPALYDAQHLAQNLSSRSATEEVYDLVGPVCESSDVFNKGLSLPESKRGDIIAIRSAGAYGETMKNEYNLRPLAQAHYSK